MTGRVALLGAFVALFTSEIHAQPRASAHLEWTRATGAETCSDVAVIERLVEERLGRSVFVDAAQADVAVRGSVERRGRGYRALVVMSHGEEALGERVLTTESADCRELDAATALVLAVAIESVTVKRVELSLPKEPLPPPPIAPPPVPKASAPPEEEVPWRGEIAAGGAFATGLLPEPALGFVVGSVVTAPRFVPLRFDVRVWFPRDGDLEQGGASFRAWQAGAAACPVILSKPLVLEACGGGSVGAISAAGFDLDRNAQASGVLVDLGLDARATLAEGRFRPWLELGAEVPLIRDRFRVNVDGEAVELHRVAPVFLVARLGGLLAIP